jgi:hypothetical protein
MISQRHTRGALGLWKRHGIVTLVFLHCCYWYYTGVHSSTIVTLYLLLLRLLYCTVATSRPTPVRLARVTSVPPTLCVCVCVCVCACVCVCVSDPLCMLIYHREKERDGCI